MPSRRVIWRSHIGRDVPNANTDRGWDFLRGYLENADAFVFSRQRYVPHWLAPDRVRVIAPSIDPFSAKNRELDDGEVSLVLRRVGLIAGADGRETVAFTQTAARTAGAAGAGVRGAAPAGSKSRTEMIAAWRRRSLRGRFSYGVRLLVTSVPRTLPTVVRRRCAPT